jgi:dTDP-4-amino-4,6-dideoxygalactose transaminase
MHMLNNTKNKGSRPFVGAPWAEAMELSLSEYVGRHVALTNSCTSAMEIAAGLLNVCAGDEWLIPTYTFGTVAGVFARRAAKITWVDSGKESPSATLETFKAAYTKNTKGIVVMPYAGMCSDLSQVVSWAKAKKLHVIEDAAHGFGGGEGGRKYGCFGDFAVYSFHSTKNLSCGEGGALVYDKKWKDEVDLWLDKGVNKQAFMRGEVSHYEWTAPAGAYAMSELHAQLLYSQWKFFKIMQEKRKARWEFIKNVAVLASSVLDTPKNNLNDHPAHLFYVKFKDEEALKKAEKVAKVGGVSLTCHFKPLSETALGVSLSKESADRCVEAKKWWQLLRRIDMETSEKAVTSWVEALA